MCVCISISWHERELYHTPTLSSFAPHRYPTSEFLPCFPTNTLNLRVYFLLYYCSYKYKYLCRNIQTHSLGEFLLFVYIHFQGRPFCIRPPMRGSYLEESNSPPRVGFQENFVCFICYHSYFYWSGPVWADNLIFKDSWINEKIQTIIMESSHPCSSPCYVVSTSNIICQYFWFLILRFPHFYHR